MLQIPVFAGAASPIISKLRKSTYHGVDGFGDIQLPNPPSLSLLQRENAVEALHKICTDNKGLFSAWPWQ